MNATREGIAGVAPLVAGGPGTAEQPVPFVEVQRGDRDPAAASELSDGQVVERRACGLTCADRTA